MIKLRKNIPTKINVDLPFIESIRKDKHSFTDLNNPNDKQQQLKKAQWNCETGEIEGVLDET